MHTCAGTNVKESHKRGEGELVAQVIIVGTVERRIREISGTCVSDGADAALASIVNDPNLATRQIIIFKLYELVGRGRGANQINQNQSQVAELGNSRDDCFNQVPAGPTLRTQ